MPLLFAIFAAACTIALLLGTGKYSKLVLSLDKDNYPLRCFLPLGLFIMDSISYTYKTGYDRWILFRLSELIGHKDSQSAIRFYWANKVVMMAAAILSALFFGMLMKPDAAYLVFAAGLVAGAAVLPDKELENKVRRKRRQIQIDFPDFTVKLTLLINAGMTVSAAWEKAALGGCPGRPLYNELEKSVKEIRSGIPEYRAYEGFAQRCRVPEVTRTISVIIQNSRKGNSELVSLLRVLSAECWESRKNAARKMGEEASVRMLFPLIIMFIAILLIVVTPAVLALRGI